MIAKGLRRIGQGVPVFNIAHRGARAFAPENTLAAFIKAKKFGCEMVELDVRMSKDGVIIVHHDDHLLRCTDAASKFPDRASYYLADFTCEELAILDAGSWYVNELLQSSSVRQPFLQSLTDKEIVRYVAHNDQAFYGSGQIKLPTLKQVLEFAKECGLLLNIELKGLSEPDLSLAMAEVVVRMVEQMAMSQQVIISSFEHHLLAQVRYASTSIATAVLSGEWLDNPIDYLQSLDADALNVGCCVGDAAKQSFIEQQISDLRALEFGVNVWTCNNSLQIQQLIAAGVTGIISDFPNRVKNAISRQRSKL